MRSDPRGDPVPCEEADNTGESESSQQRGGYDWSVIEFAAGECGQRKPGCPADDRDVDEPRH